MLGERRTAHSASRSGMAGRSERKALCIHTSPSAAIPTTTKNTAAVIAQPRDRRDRREGGGRSPPAGGGGPSSRRPNPGDDEGGEEIRDVTPHSRRPARRRQGGWEINQPGRRKRDRDSSRRR